MQRTSSLNDRARALAPAGSSLIAIAFASLIAAAPAQAQDAAPAAPPADTATAQDAVEEGAPSGDIVVTGSRLGAGFTAPTPVTAIPAQQIEDRAITSVAELNYEIPQLRINQNVGRSSEPVGQNQVDLRALGSARTLLLLDGRRLAATSPFGGIDSNIFPVALISSVDVVTGGASAAYGSDAVAGVVNFGLQKEFEGLKVDASYGISKYSDFKRPVISAAAGTSLMDGRLHLSVAGDYYRNKGQTRVASRKWGRGSPILFSNPTFTTTNGQTRNYIAYDGRLVASYGGLIVGNNADTNPANGADVFRGVQFGPGGTLLPYSYGSIASTSFQLGGDGVTMIDDGNLLPFIRRHSGYGRASFDITDNISIWSDVLYSKVKVNSDLAPNYDWFSTALTIQRDNAFLPTAVRNTMLANNISSIRLSRINIEDEYSQNNSETRALRYAAGVEGQFGDGWSFDAFVQRSDNRFRQDSVNNRLQSRWLAGVDSILVNGTPTCRVNADTNPNNNLPGCVPINVFGPGSITAPMLAWYRGTSYYDAKMTQNAAGLNIKGTPFATWAGDVAVAFGGEARHEFVNSVSDPFSTVPTASGTLGDWRSINQQPFSGKVNVKEFYLEAAVPLAKETPFAYDLELNGAIRYADYSTSGGVTTWKLGVNYTPVRGLRLRGTLSRDIRAANLYELFAGPNQVINSQPDPRPNAPLASYNIKQLSGGNANLRPEKADTMAFGVVLQPAVIPGLNASVDFYKIKIDDAITVITASNILRGCFLNNIQDFCDGITVDPVSNLVTLIKSTYVNAQTIEISGVDAEIAYRRPVAWFGQEGSFGGRLLVNYLHDSSVTALNVKTVNLGDIATDPGGQPRWKYNFDLTYQGGPLRVGAYVRYIGGGKFRTIYVDDVDLPADQNRVKGQTYVDISTSYKITDNIEIYGKVDNLFDNAPPVIPNAIVQPTVSNSQMYDKIGRYYVGGVRLRF